MQYPISKAEVDRLGELLEEYYNNAWQEGIKGVLDNMRRANMGIVTGYLDQAKDTFNNLRKESSDSFMTTFKADLKGEVTRYFANKNDAVAPLVTIGEAILKAAAKHIPVPVLGSVIGAIVGLVATEAREELNERSITEADKQLMAKSGAELQKFFTKDSEAIEFIRKSIEQYKTLGRFISTMPSMPTSFDDAITFPKSVFKVQQAASSLNVALQSIQQYIAAMQERLVQAQKISAGYIVTVRKEMPLAVETVIQSAYIEGAKRGQTDIASKKYTAPPLPVYKKPVKPGGATQLAAYVAHAMALGYYEVGNRIMPGGHHDAPTRPRSNAMAGPPPLPPRIR